MGGEERPMKEEERTPQISDDLVTRMDRAERQSEESEERPGEMPAESDFAAILDALPGDDPGSLSQAFTAPPSAEREEASRRDRNLSSVIERIRDEGPAEAEGTDLAEDVLELGPGAEAETGGDEAEERPLPVVEPAPVVKRDPEPSPAAVRGGNEVTRRKGFQMLVNLALLGAVVVLGFLQYRQLEADARLRAQLEDARRALAELQQAQGVFAERLAGLQDEREPEAGTVSREELEAALQSQRQRMEGQIERVAAMLLPVMTAPSVALEKGEQGASRKAAARGGEERHEAAPARGWMVVLLSSSSRAQAEKARRQLGKRVDNLEIRTARVKGRTVYRLAVPGFPSRKAALEYRSRMAGQAGFEGAWVGRG